MMATSAAAITCHENSVDIDKLKRGHDEPERILGFGNGARTGRDDGVDFGVDWSNFLSSAERVRNRFLARLRLVTQRHRAAVPTGHP